MAECHPVGFQWVMEAKARGAVLIHVDPRFTRTSALADIHVPLRRTMALAHLGGATLDNEENYLIKKLFTALGAIQIENQARI